MIHSIVIPKDVRLLGDIFHAVDCPLWIVGGYVRDSFLGENPKDVDLVTELIPEDVIALLGSRGITTFPKGIAFGVVSAMVNGVEYEIATCRSDGIYADGRRPDSVTYGTIEHDSYRRDLTINSVYVNVTTEEIFDLHGGVDDISNRIVRTVGSPHMRFSEDPLRILRFLRFHHRFRSDSVGPDMLGIIADFSQLKGVSKERIVDEFTKGIMSANSPRQYVSDMKWSGVWASVFPNADTWHFLNAEHNDETKSLAAYLALVTRSLSISHDDYLIDLGWSRNLSKMASFLNVAVRNDPRDVTHLLRYIAGRVHNRYKEMISDCHAYEKLTEENICIIRYTKTAWVRDFPGFSGKELGEKIAEKEKKNFSEFVDAYAT